MDSRGKGLLVRACVRSGGVDRGHDSGGCRPVPEERLRRRRSPTRARSHRRPSAPTSQLGATINFQGWFEIESVAPGALRHDELRVPERRPTRPTCGTRSGISSRRRTWHPPRARPTSPTRTTARASRRASRPSPSICRPALTGAQFRIRFDTGDNTYQGFRGVGIDTITTIGATPSPERPSTPGLPRAGPSTRPSGPGGPFWQVPTSPSSIASRARRSTRIS